MLFFFSDLEQDKGTTALDILSGFSYPLKLGFVGVVNRSQYDIQTGKPISKMLEDEANFFKTHPVYKSVADRCGTAYLAQHCNKV